MARTRTFVDINVLIAKTVEFVKAKKSQKELADHFGLQVPNMNQKLSQMRKLLEEKHPAMFKSLEPFLYFEGKGKKGKKEFNIDTLTELQKLCLAVTGQSTDDKQAVDAVKENNLAMMQGENLSKKQRQEVKEKAAKTTVAA